MLCEICLQSEDRAKLTRRDLSAFYALCAAGERKDAWTLLCAFCWRRVTQCVHFIKTAKSSQCTLDKQCSSKVQQTMLYPYALYRLPNTVACNDRPCAKVLQNNKMLKEPHFETVTIVPPDNFELFTNLRLLPQIKVEVEIESNLKINSQDVTSEPEMTKCTTIVKDEIIHNDNSCVSQKNHTNKQAVHCRNSKKKSKIEKKLQNSIVSSIKIDDRPLENEIEYEDSYTMEDMQDNGEPLIGFSTWGELVKAAEERRIALGLEEIMFTEEQAKEEIEKKKAIARFEYAKSRCDKCGSVLKNEASLMIHVERYHSSEAGPYECHICAHRFRYPSALAEHQTSEHFRRWRCVRCDVVVTRFTWRNHGTACLPDARAYECELCGKKFATKYRYSRHMQRMHGSKSLMSTCDICNKTYKSKYQLNDHMQTHTGDSPHKCDQCDRKFVSVKNLRAHVNLKHKAWNEPLEERYCVECDQYFVTKRILEIHLRQSRRHVDPDSFRFECHMCQRKFFDKPSLSEHIKFKHTTGLECSCHVCGKVFKNKKYLRQHVTNVHHSSNSGKSKVASKKIHMCDLCGNTYKTKEVMRQHKIAVHEKQRPYKCEVCGATFGFSAGLYTHRRLKHRTNNEQPCTSVVAE